MTGYRLDGPGSNPGGGEIFRTCPDRPWGPPSLLYNGYRVFPGGKERPGRVADHSPPSSATVKKEYSYTSTPPMGRTACTESQCLYKGTLYLYILNHFIILTYVPCIFLFLFEPTNAQLYSTRVFLYRIYTSSCSHLFCGHKWCRPLAGYTLYDHKTNDCIRRELRITGILDKIDEYRRNWFSHLQRMPHNRIPLKSYRYVYNTLVLF